MCYEYVLLSPSAALWCAVCCVRVRCASHFSFIAAIFLIYAVSTYLYNALDPNRALHRGTAPPHRSIVSVGACSCARWSHRRHRHPAGSRFDSFDGRHVETWQREHIHNPGSKSRHGPGPAHVLRARSCLSHWCCRRAVGAAAHVLHTCLCRRKRVPDYRPTSDCAEEAASDRGEVQDKRHTGLTRPIFSKKRRPSMHCWLTVARQNCPSCLGSAEPGGNNRGHDGLTSV